MAERYFGIYRATALNTNDPMGMNRIQVLVPSITGQGSGWAAACVSPGVTSLPNVGDTVWVMFEAGDPTSPVWVGVSP